MLNADELGAKGEARFKEICADSNLICNQSDRDRTGWDFIVEFPFEIPNGQISLENRRTPISCHVQVKTLFERNDRFEMRLSSAERLAKELKPAFVYVFKVNDALEFTGAHLVHILDAPLGKILKRLRQAAVGGNSRANNRIISMSANAEGLKVAPTGAALRNALMQICGADPHAYVAKKAEQLEKLGYERRPFELELTLALNSIDEFVDVSLGLVKNVPASNVRSTLTRFGIKARLPPYSAPATTISLQPTPVEHVHDHRSHTRPFSSGCIQGKGVLSAYS